VLKRKIKISLIALAVILLLNGFVFGYVITIDSTDYDFQYRRPITIQGSKVPGANNNYPFMFNSTKPSGTGLPDDLKQFPTGKVRNADGYDIVFADEAGGNTQYDHEIEYYDPSSGEYIAWVKVNLTGGDQTIYLYYGSTDVGSTDTQHVTSVWSDSYDRVLHLHDYSDSSGKRYVKDSVNNSYSAMAKPDAGPPTTAGGIVYNGFDLNRGDGDFIDSQFERDYSYSALSFECWFDANSYSPTGTRFMIGLRPLNRNSLMRIAIRVTDTDTNGFAQYYLRSETENADLQYDPGNVFGADAWHYAVFTCGSRNNATMITYWDGDPTGVNYNDMDGQVNLTDGGGADGDFYIGALNDQGNSSNLYDGKIDEVRFAKVELDANWIKTTYNNIYEPETFYTIGGGTTLVMLSHFRATSLDSAVLLEWATETELDNEGFNLWRSEEKEGEYVQINPYFIPARDDAGFGAEYSFTDYEVTNGVIYYYKLEDIDIYGKSTFHGPVSAIPNDIIPIWPPDREVLPSDVSLFSWSSFGSFSFKVEISTNPSFPDSGMLTFPEEGWLSGLSLWLRPEEWEIILSKAQQSGGQLFWRVKAKSQDGKVVYSNWRRFVIE